MQYLSFIPWLLFFPVYALNAYIEMYTKNTKKSTKWFKENPVLAFRFDIILLLGLFIYFLTQKNNTVIMMLFTVMHIYLLVNAMYDIPKIKNFSKEHIKLLLIYFIVALIPVIIFLITKNYNTICLIMFGYTFFAYLIVILLKWLHGKLKKKSR